MKNIVIGIAVLLAGTSLGACSQADEPANADVAADMNTVVMPDENAGMTADMNAADPAAMNADMDAADNAAMNADANATENRTKQGSTDH